MDEKGFTEIPRNDVLIKSEIVMKKWLQIIIKLL